MGCCLMRARTCWCFQFLHVTGRCMISAELQQGIDWLTQRYLCARAIGDHRAGQSLAEVDRLEPTSESVGCYDRRAIALFRSAVRAAAVVGRPLHVHQPNIGLACATAPGDGLPASDPRDSACGFAEAAKSIQAIRDLFCPCRQPVPCETRYRPDIERALRFEGATIHSVASNQRPLAEDRRHRSEFQMIRRALLRSKAHSSSLAEFQR